MLNEGGCDRLSAGIGNISYVKDLQTETIVTTKFRCSKFSSYHSTSDTHGWVRFKTTNSRTLYQGMWGTSDIVCACVLMGWGQVFQFLNFFLHELIFINFCPKICRGERWMHLQITRSKNCIKLNLFSGYVKHLFWTSVFAREKWLFRSFQVKTFLKYYRVQRKKKLTISQYSFLNLL